MCNENFYQLGNTVREEEKTEQTRMRVSQYGCFIMYYIKGLCPHSRLHVFSEDQISAGQQLEQEVNCHTNR